MSKKYFLPPINNITQPIYESLSALHSLIEQHGLKAILTAVNYHNVYVDIEKEKYNYKQKIIKMWTDLELELNTENRYFPQTDFIKIFEKYANEARYILRNNSTLYRARKIEDNDLQLEVNELLNHLYGIYYDPEKQNHFMKKTNFEDFINSIPNDKWLDKYLIKFNLNANTFWGYNAKDSGAPPSSSLQGRVNPSGISYLYTATKPKTAIMEIQPIIGQKISIAEIKTNKKLNLFNFDFYGAYKDSKLMNLHIGEIKEKLDLTNYWQLEVFFSTISELFSKPALGNSNNYFTTQYISEFIKKQEFDGIKYKSSLHKGGSNIVLFDITENSIGLPNNYTIINTTLHKVESVKVSSRLVLPKEQKYEKSS